MIDISNITKSYNNRMVLNNVSIKLEDNSIVGLYGDSGVGKSTLAKIICGLLKTDNGEIKKTYSVQMVYQQPQAILDPSQRIIDGIKELIKYHKLCPNKNIDNLIDEMCKSIELKRDILNHYPQQISGGEAQRIALGKALLLKPDLLILDEATSMLDVSTQANIYSLIKKELNKSFKTVLWISHDIELLKFCCDIIYQLDNGIIKEAKKDEL